MSEHISASTVKQEIYDIPDETCQAPDETDNSQ